MENHDIDRRTFVSVTGAVGGIALSGCLGVPTNHGADETDNGSNETDDESNETDGGSNDPDFGPRFPEIEDPPDAVYLPTHRESMRTLEPVTAGDYRLAPMLSYPHPFWTVADGSGDEATRVPIETMSGIHLMFTLWDAETGVVLPVDNGAVVTLARDGQRVERQSMWPMLSQEMGFHFGDNVPLDEDGTYAVSVELPPLSTRTTGDLAGRFTDRETATFEFEYDQAFREAVVDVDYFDEERWGERGALEPMGRGDEDGHEGHAVPYSQVPEVGAFPGTILREPDAERPETTEDLPRSGDAAVLATLLESDHRLSDGDGRYLLVSPRTPYNRVPLPHMRLDATIEPDGEAVSDEPVALVQTIDGEYGIHYGATLADVQSGDTVGLTVRRPPQVARHRGYETAFLEMPPIELQVPEDHDG